MKKWIKYTLIGFGVLLVLNVIIEMTKSPEQRIEEERQRSMKDSIEKVRKDSIERVGLGVSLKDVTKGIEYNGWKKSESGTSRLWNREHMRVVFSGDETNLTFIGVYIRPSRDVKEDVEILSKMFTSICGEESSSKIITNISQAMTQNTTPSSWTIGDKISLEYAWDKVTGELLVSMTRKKNG